jgi:hypothetical protein
VEILQDCVDTGHSGEGLDSMGIPAVHSERMRSRLRSRGAQLLECGSMFCGLIDVIRVLIP